MPKRDVRVAVGERNTGMSKISRTTWRAGAVGLVFSGLLAGVLHNTATGPARPAHSPGSTSGSAQVTSGGS
jgi:hypothetical protein